MSSRLTAAELTRARVFVDAALDREEHGTLSEDARTLQQQFWTEIRAHLCSNAMSTGLEHLGQLTEDVMDHKDGVVLRGTVLALPAPPAANVPSSTVPPAPVPAEPPVPSSRESSKGKKPARSKRKADDDDSTVNPPSKKSRSTSKSKKDEKKGVVCVPSAAFATLLDVNAMAPKYVRAAIAAVLAKVEAAGKKPWRLAYPRHGCPLWYDPDKFRHVHRAHWRYWMSNRRAFWEWEFHVPLDSKASQGNRRKLKSRAVQALLVFTSFCIETVNHEGRSYDGPLAEDLATLARKDKARYTATLENVLDPSAIDNYGYPSVRSLLESTEALDPKVNEKNRLSLPALARVRRDIMSSVRPMDTWAGSRTEEPWKSLVNNYNIKQNQDREDWSAFEDEDDEDEKPAEATEDADPPADDEEVEDEEEADEEESAEEEAAEEEDDDEEEGDNKEAVD
ncbi:hypothetical protein PC110_g22339 [Phytophthora cactorum]|uniref:Uncharacterized protein n=2 Tax=Phytophthora cactorum TaxID=29920 RepID=A0A329RDB5_9STRA|nr:hypothetical protein PC110_g22339 [Phytophthora cactorum]